MSQVEDYSFDSISVSSKKKCKKKFSRSKSESSQEFYHEKRFLSELAPLVLSQSSSDDISNNNLEPINVFFSSDSYGYADYISEDGDNWRPSSFLAYAMLVLCFLFKFIQAIGVSVILIDIIVSFYSVIIINYVFFISTIISYILSPLYHGLSEDWMPYVFSLIQIILANPMIEFFLFFVIKTVKNFIDSIGKFATIIQYFFFSAITDVHDMLVHLNLSYFIKKNMVMDTISLIWKSLLCLGVAGGVTYVTFGINKLMIILGMIPYAVIVIQIIILFVPTYFYYGRILRGVRKNEPVLTERFLKDTITTYNKLIKQTNGQRNVKMQTEENAFGDSLFHPLDLSSQSDYSSSRDSGQHLPRETMDEKSDKMLYRIAYDICPLFVAVEYVPIFEYTLDIGYDKFTITRKRFLLLLFTLFHFATVAFDIYRLLYNWSAYFLVSIILRIVFFPLFCYFNIGTAFLYRAKSDILHFVVIISTAFTFIVFIASLCALFYTKFISSITRISELDYIPNSTILHHGVFNDACFYTYQGLTLIDAYGLALGPFDVDRNYAIFDNQMKYFFGREWNQTIRYEVHYIDQKTPFLIYTINENLIVYGFRGFSSGTELCLQIEMVAMDYVLPFCQDIVPFYRIFVDNFIGFYSRFAHNFGNQFFDPVSLSSLFVDPIEAVYQSKNYSENAQIVFTGINIGGMIAKVLGMIHKKQGIGFITFPAFNDYFLNTFHFADDDSIFITNVYNYNGWFTKQEPGVATNIGVPWISGTNFIERDSIYRTFCTITEMCGLSSKFSNYCAAVVNDMETIKEYFKDIPKTNYTLEKPNID